jgi:hypothetical protein
MSWEIDLWGKIRRSSEAANAQLLASEEGRRAVLLSLVSDVAQAYFELLELDARLAIASSSTEAYQGTFKLFQDRLGVRGRFAAADGASGGQPRPGRRHGPGDSEPDRGQGESDQHAPRPQSRAPSSAAGRCSIRR